MTERREVTIDELAEMRKNKPTGTLAKLKVKGIATIFDKDGKVKGKMDIVSLDSTED